MSETATLKQQLRAQLREQRQARQPDQAFDDQLSQQIGQLCLDSRTRTVAAYFPIQSEPNIVAFLNWAVANDLRVMLPSVRGTDLHWVYFDGKTEFGELGFEEASGKPAKLTDAELIFVPAMAIDLKGNRLGKGKGYYDRALSAVFAQRKRAKVVAVVFENEVLLSVPVEAHDHPVDGVITAGKLLWFNA
jgi:5-formyltetrahydrofolate cyclo-ligase